MLKGKGNLQGPFTALSAEFEDTLLNLWGVKQNPEQTEDKKDASLFHLKRFNCISQISICANGVLARILLVVV